MARFVWHKGDWREVVWTLPAPRVAIISDTMQPARHMVTGEVLDSKSQFRSRTKDAGCVELGNDAPASPRPVQLDGPAVRESIAQSIRELEAGRPAPRAETIDGTTRVYE